MSADVAADAACDDDVLSKNVPKQISRRQKRMASTGKAYICSRCGLWGPRRSFSKNLTRDLKRNTQQCLECKSGRRGGKVCIVEVCKQFVKEENLTQTQKHNRSRVLVCAVCADRGYTLKDPKTYTCSVCKNVTGSRMLFKESNLTRDAKRGIQTCKKCVG